MVKIQSSQLQQLNTDLQQKLLYSNSIQLDESVKQDDKGMKLLLKNITTQICEMDKVSVC